MKKPFLLLLTSFFILTGCSNPNDLNHSQDSSNLLNDYLNLAKESVKLESNSTFNELNEYFTTIYEGTSYYMDDGFSYPEAKDIKIPSSQLQAYNITVEGDTMTQHMTSLDNKDHTITATGDVSITQNPFALLEINKFIKQDNGTYNYADLEVGKEFIARVSGYGVTNISEFNFKVNQDVSFDIKASVTSTNETVVNYNIHAFDLGCAHIPSVTYESKPYHDNLKKAFDNFDVSSYTLDISDTSYFSYDKPVSYQILKTNDIILKSEGDDAYGHAEREDGVFDFVVGGDNNTYLEKQNTAKFSPFSFTPTFEIAPELFMLNEDGSYSLINPRLAPEASTAFELERVLAYQCVNALNFKLHIKDDNLSGIEFDYHIFDPNQPILGHVKVDISNIGKTRLPEDINFDGALIPLTPKSLNVPNDYYGIYHGVCVGDSRFLGRTDIDIEITSDYVKVVGVKLPIISYSETRGIEISVNNERYFIKNNSSTPGYTILSFMSKDGVSTMVNNMDKEGQEDQGGLNNNIPVSFQGEYMVDVNVGLLNNKKQVNLLIKPNKVIIDNIEVSNLNYDSFEGYISFIYGGQVMLIQNFGTSLKIMDEINDNGDVIFGRNIFASSYKKDSYIPMDVYGTYKGSLTKGMIDGNSEVNIIISDSGIKLNGKSLTSYTYNDLNNVISFKINDITYTLTNTSQDDVKYCLNASDDSISSIVLTRTLTSISSSLKGVLSGTFSEDKLLENKAGVELNVEENKIILNGIECEILSLSSTCVKFLYKQEVLYLSGFNGVFDLYNKDLSIFAHQINRVKIPTYLIGEWSADLNKEINGSKVLHAVISSTGVIINGLKASGLKYHNDEDHGEYLTFDLLGKTFQIGNFIDFKSLDNQIIATHFERFPIVLEKSLGTWTGTFKVGTYKGSNQVTIIVSETTISINGDVYRIYKSLTNGTYYIEIDGKTYLFVTDFEIKDEKDQVIGHKTIFRSYLDSEPSEKLETNPLQKTN